MIQWDDKYKTGIDHLDEQHKTLFQYLNDLEDAVREDDVGHGLMVETLNFFEKYAKMHFGDEEGCMYRLQCPAAKANLNAHHSFIAFFDKCRGQMEADGYNEKFFREVLDFMEEWLIEHICRIDTQLKPCVHQ